VWRLQNASDREDRTASPIAVPSLKGTVSGSPKAAANLIEEKQLFAD
jgi:hypothetical protein